MSSLSSLAVAVFAKLDVTPAEVAEDVAARGVSLTAYWYWETMLYGHFEEEEVFEVFSELA